MNDYLRLGLLTVAAYGLVAPCPTQAKLIILLGNAVPDRRTGTVAMNAATIATMVGADTTWDNKTKAVRITRGDRSVIFRAGNRTALVSGKRSALPVVPYFDGDMLMVPAKFTATAFAVPLRLESKTDSVVIGPVEGTRNSNTVFIVPMDTNRTGFLVHSPKPGSMVTTNNQVRLQANVPERQELVLQLREADGSVLIENVLPALRRAPGRPKTSGQFNEHIVGLTRTSSEDKGRKVRFVAFMRKATRPPLPPPTVPLPKPPPFNPIVPVPRQIEAGAATAAPKK